MDKNTKISTKLQIFHLLPSKDLGGAEIASKTCNFIDNKNCIVYEGSQKTFKKVFELKKSANDFNVIRNNAINTWKNKKLYEEDIFYNCKLISKT